jgi:predicted nuclease of predicted toxin-antitoxin system
MMKGGIVISKDVDFLESNILKSSPRKLILVRVGNISNKQLIDIFNENLEILVRMIARSNLLEVGKTEIAEHD